VYYYSKMLRKVKKVSGEDKLVWWEWAGKGFWEQGTGGIDTHTLLYRSELAKLLSRQTGLPICLVEGEKDADVLMFKGFPATCSAHGASEPDKAPKWYKVHSEQLSGWNICVFNDDDPAGLAHAEATCQLSHQLSHCQIKRLDHATFFPGTKDIAQWFKNGGTTSQLLDLIANAPEWTPCQRNG
jgi:hypothetical protein